MRRGTGHEEVQQQIADGRESLGGASADSLGGVAFRQVGLLSASLGNTAVVPPLKYPKSRRTKLLMHVVTAVTAAMAYILPSRW